MSFWPASVPEDRQRPASKVAAESLRHTAVGAGRLIWWWPGIVIVLVAYTAVAVGLAGHSYPNLWGGLAAVLVAAAWYASPLRRLESRRRDRLRLATRQREASGGGPGPGPG